MDWVTKQIAIGNYLDAKNASPAEIDAILCLRPDCCDENNDSFDILCIPLTDGAGNNRRFFDEAIDFLDDVVSRGEKILVHCHAGRSRSVCIVARYFMLKHNMTSQQALEKIALKREIYLSTGIEEILNLTL
jgi:protein-tyrosine phosphatase